MKKLIIILCILLCFAIAALGGVYGTYQYFNTAPGYSQDTSFTVTRGMTLRAAAHELERSGLIKNSDFFVLLAYINKSPSILTGQYKISAGSSAGDILAKLSRGSVETVSVTIPEGFNLYQIAPALEQAGICSSEKFMFFAQNRQFLGSLGIKAPSVEGYLFPETYSFARNTDPRDVIIHMKKTMDQVITSLDYSSHLPQGMTLHQYLIIASLVEKEARIKSEQPLVASVFLNRVKRGMRFDSDPTVRYAVKKFTGRIRYRDLDSDSPYNTYRVAGYPPTPIASPGKGALEAVLHPADSSFLFFVARNDGSHYFSRTMARHSRAVDYYQKGMHNGFHDDQR